MHGLKLIREIHRESPEAKIIIISAFGTPEIKEEAMMDGIDQFFDKPFEIMDVRKAVNEMLQRVDHRI